MKEAGKYILIGGAIFAGYWLYNKYRAYQLLNIRPASFRFGGSILQPIIYITLALDNPSDQSANLNSIAGTVYADNGQSIATVMYPIGKSIQPFTTTYIEVPVNVYLTGGLSPAPKSIRFQGTANVNGINIPFTLTQLLT